MLVLHITATPCSLLPQVTYSETQLKSTSNFTVMSLSMGSTAGFCLTGNRNILPPHPGIETRPLSPCNATYWTVSIQAYPRDRPCPREDWYQFLWNTSSSSDITVALLNRLFLQRDVEDHEVVRRLEAPTFVGSRLTHGAEVSLTAPAALYPSGRFLVLISIRGWVDPRAKVRLKGFGQLKRPVTSSGLEPATFRLVA
jgi:hypothetical protein